jgi:predicted nucleotidyltransferase
MLGFGTNVRYNLPPLPVSTPRIRGGKMKFERILKELKEEIAEAIGEKFEALLLFGSYSRGEEREFSDLDLLLLVKERLTAYEKSKIDEITGRFSLENDIVISCIDYPVNLYEEYNTPFLLNVKEEAIKI